MIISSNIKFYPRNLDEEKIEITKRNSDFLIDFIVKILVYIFY